MSTPSETMRTATIQGGVPCANALIFSEALGSSDVATTARDPEPLLHDLRDAARVLLIHRDDQPGGARVAGAQVAQLRVGLLDHRRQPVALGVERGAQPLVRQLARQRIVERRRVFQPARRRPFHVTLDAREIDRAHDRAIFQSLAVTVFVVGLGQIAVVAHEGDGVLIGSERRARQ